MHAATALAPVFRLLLAVLLSTAPAVQAAPPSSLPPLQDGDVLLMRHALAPGTGDPVGLRLGDCGTQRNLSDAGREQARAIGNRLRELQPAVRAVWASPWCRTRDTATLALPALPLVERQDFGSFFGQAQQEAEQTRRAQALLATWRGPGLLLVVTHQVNITALTGVWPASGELLLLRGGSLLARWAPH